MAAIGNKVRFIQFNGYLDEWNDSIQQGIWYNAVVFGYIYDPSNDTVITKIYAGKDTNGVDFIFDFDKSKWQYGDVSKGWHTASDHITNKVGSITTNMTLGDLMNMTEGGQISRILELMLFKQSGPMIHLQAYATETSPKNSIDVICNVTDAVNVNMKVTDIDGKVIKDSPISASESITLGNLKPNMEYNVLVVATNEVESTQKTVSVMTHVADQPIVVIDSIEHLPNTSNNYYRISDISYITTPNDYNVNNDVTYNLTEPGVAPKEYLTLDELKAEDLKYNTNYTVIQNFDASCIYHYPDEEPEIEHFTSNNKFVNVPVTGSGNAVISKINGVAITTSTVMPIVLSTPVVNIEYSINPRLVNADVYLYKNNIGFDTSSNTLAGTYVFTETLQQSTNNQDIIIRLSDEYNDSYASSNTVSLKYGQSVGNCMMTVLSTNSSHYYPALSDYVKTTDILNALGSRSTDVSAAYWVIEKTLNPNYTLGGQSLIDFINEAKDMDYFDIASSSLINTTSKPGETCYGYDFTQPSFTESIIYAIAPAGSKIKFYDSDVNNAPNNELSIKKADNEITISGNVYNVWYIKTSFQRIVNMRFWMSIVPE